MSEPFLGEIKMLGFSFSPRGFTFCAGQLMPIAENQALFALLATQYGGDGRTTFGLPNLTSRLPMGFNMGDSQGLQAYPPGTMMGSQHHSLQVFEMPLHNHSATFTAEGEGGPAQLEATTEEGDASTPSPGAYLSQTKATGGPQDHPENIYKSGPTPGSLVSLGGVSGGGASGGTVQVGDTGEGQSFSIMNPVIAINFSIAIQGLFPTRN